MRIMHRQHPYPTHRCLTAQRRECIERLAALALLLGSAIVSITILCAVVRAIINL